MVGISGGTVHAKERTWIVGRKEGLRGRVGGEGFGGCFDRRVIPGTSTFVLCMCVCGRLSVYVRVCSEAFAALGSFCSPLPDARNASPTPSPSVLLVDPVAVFAVVVVFCCPPPPPPRPP